MHGKVNHLPHFSLLSICSIQASDPPTQVQRSHLFLCLSAAKILPEDWPQHNMLGPANSQQHHTTLPQESKSVRENSIHLSNTASYRHQFHCLLEYGCLFISCLSSVWGWAPPTHTLVIVLLLGPDLNHCCREQPQEFGQLGALTW